MVCGIFFFFGGGVTCICVSEDSRSLMGESTIVNMSD